MNEIPIILLAAGESKRMGEPKQLLTWGNKTLIEHQIHTLIETGNPLIVVLGSHSDKIIPIIQKKQVSIVINERWRNGMGSSVSTGVSFAWEKYPQAEGVLIVLIDQPLVLSSHYRNLKAAFIPGKKQILASRAKDRWLGVPALFDAFYFDELIELDGDEGARGIIKKYDSQVIPIDADEQLEDMDNQESYFQMQRRSSN